MKNVRQPSLPALAEDAVMSQQAQGDIGSSTRNLRAPEATRRTPQRHNSKDNRPSLAPARSIRQSICITDLEKAKSIGKGSGSSWFQLSCTSHNSSEYSSYHSFGHGELSDVDVALMESQQNMGMSMRQSCISRQEKEALGNMHGFCFTESEGESDSEDEYDDECKQEAIVDIPQDLALVAEQ